MACNETNPCFGGLCQDGACNCFALWTGDYCDTNVLSLDETMYRFFWGYLWSILIIFSLITIAALVQLALLIVDHKRTARRLNKVKVMLFALIAAIGISKSDVNCNIFLILQSNSIEIHSNHFLY
jgi:hypothetical protein